MFVSNIKGTCCKTGAFKFFMKVKAIKKAAKYDSLHLSRRT